MSPTLRADPPLIFRWTIGRHSYHITLHFSAQKTRSGVKAEVVVKRAFAEVVNELGLVNAGFTTHRLVFRDFEDSCVVECSGSVKDRAAARKVFKARSAE